MRKNTRKNVQGNIFNNSKKRKKPCMYITIYSSMKYKAVKTYGQNTCVNTFI